MSLLELGVAVVILLLGAALYGLARVLEELTVIRAALERLERADEIEATDW